MGYGNIKKNIINESIKKENMIVDDPSMKNLILDIIKNNTNALKEIMDVCKNMNNTTNNNISNTNNTNNSNNKTFNLQVFLNGQCKDAVNLSDFINSIELNLSDLENMEKFGYTDCMNKNPTFKYHDSPYNDKYLKIVSGDKDHMDKVIRKLAKNCVIDKSIL